MSEKAPGWGGRENEWAGGARRPEASHGSLPEESCWFSLDSSEAQWVGCGAGLHTFSPGRVCKEELGTLSPRPQDQEELWQ